MSLCINQSGTWRNTTTLCVNQSGTWRNIVTGCINDSSTWRKFSGGTPPTTLGSSYGGGFAICFQSTGFAGGRVWIVAPSSTQVSRTWHARADAVTTAQASAACGDWFVPDFGQLQNPGSTCKIHWDSYSIGRYWSSTQFHSGNAGSVNVDTGAAYLYDGDNKTCVRFVRAFRCATY